MYGDVVQSYLYVLQCKLITRTIRDNIVYDRRVSYYINIIIMSVNEPPFLVRFTENVGFLSVRERQMGKSTI